MTKERAHRRSGASIRRSFSETSLLFVLLLILCYKGPCTSRSKKSWRYVGLLGACFVQGSFDEYVTSTGDMITLQRQNAKNLKQIFPEKEYRGLSPNFHIHVSVSELYIPAMGLPFLLEEICGPILGIYKSLTDTWIWKLGLRPRNSQKRNT